MVVAVGQSFGNFQVVRLLGEGGFGEVYEAENPYLRRRAAIKVLHTGMVQDPELVRRFLNEARAASAIRHPNIIDVFDAGVTPEGEPYILMEYLDGDSLQKAISQQGRMPLRAALEVARQAGSALSAAHAAGIVHRDLKPENLFLIEDTGMPLGFRVKVLDFGIAKIKPRGDERGSTQKTPTGMLMGSPAYMSPEQCRDSSDVDLRTDIYSLAIIVYEMMAGVAPFTSTSATEMLVMQLSYEPPPLRQHVPDVPEHVEQAVMRALAKDRELRYGTIEQFIGALQGDDPALAAQGSSTPMTDGRQPTPSPAVARSFSSRFGFTPAPVAGPSITTLSRATGEARSASDQDDQDDQDFEAVRPKRWPLVLGFGAVAAAAGIFFALRTGTPPASVRAPEHPVPESAAAVVTPPAATVRVFVQSSPVGASVIDEGDGHVLGITPLQKSYPQAKGTMGLGLRLAGYKDKSIVVPLDVSSSTSVDLEREAAATRADTIPKPVVKSAGARKPSPVHKPPNPTHNEEDEWQVH
ncbi:MAG TPA: serine/threonine-protein kinase [Polyangia bacterium]